MIIEGSFERSPTNRHLISCRKPFKHVQEVDRSGLIEYKMKRLNKRKEKGGKIKSNKLWMILKD